MTNAALPIVPTIVRVSMAHAALEWMARESGCDLLHVKGPTIDPRTGVPLRSGTDADVLVRPSQVLQFMAVVSRSGWQLHSTFASGSPFGHAATFHHKVWGFADLHRHFPGVTTEPETAFDLLWEGRRLRDIAGVPIFVPGLAAQTMILVLNAARRSGREARADITHAWLKADQSLRAEVCELVTRMGAEVAFAAGSGNLEDYRDRRSYRLWRVASQGGTRTEEWYARFIAAPNLRARLALLCRLPLVNVHHLETVLGRPATRTDIVRAFFGRAAQGARELRTLSIGMGSKVGRR